MTEPTTSVMDDLKAALDKLYHVPDNTDVDEAYKLIECAMSKIQNLRCDAIAALDKL